MITPIASLESGLPVAVLMNHIYPEPTMVPWLPMQAENGSLLSTVHELLGSKI